MRHQYTVKPWDPMKLSLLQRYPYFTGSFIQHIYIALGPPLPVLIIEVSLL